MKNLLIYTHPKKDFTEECHKLAKVQIENSLEWGWKREDILLYTNFEYQYLGVKSIVIPYIYCEGDPTSNKIPVIAYLIKEGLPDNTYWYHDFDAYQEQSLEMDVKHFALSKYGYKDEWQCGSFFFRPSNLFELWTKEMTKRPRSRNDEKTMKRMVNEGLVNPQELDVSYNITFRYIHRTVKGNPKIIHFHPDYKDHLMKYRALDIFKGKNKLNKRIISQKLLRIFRDYGIK